MGLHLNSEDMIFKLSCRRKIMRRRRIWMKLLTLSTGLLIQPRSFKERPTESETGMRSQSQTEMGQSCQASFMSWCQTIFVFFTVCS